MARILTAFLVDDPSNLTRSVLRQFVWFLFNMLGFSNLKNVSSYSERIFSYLEYASSYSEYVSSNLKYISWFVVLNCVIH
jgi:hypothetical protein